MKFLKAFLHQPEIVMKYTFGLLLLALIFLYACSGNTTSPDQGSESPPVPKVDDGKGIGEVKSVKLNVPLKPALVDEGKSIYELKCAACHKLTDKRVVGPGWAGLTSKRKPEWIMNMITNVEVMLAEDPTAQKLLEECLTRMPNQNLTIDDSRAVLEFMYANDGLEVGN